MAVLKETIQSAVAAGNLLESTGKNIQTLLDAGELPFYRSVIEELAAQGSWDELNDRFFKTLAFGTGGLRGRTIGKIVTAAERGKPTDKGRPEFPCVGTNALNYFNISRATQGLVRYLKNWFAETKRPGRPALAIAHDTRHFSPEFAQLAAKVASENGCDVYLFAEPRSTPELSFAVRYTGSQAGIVITASHNPPHDNGYKVYFGDGAQVVEPHASGIIREVNAIESETYESLPEKERGTIYRILEEIDTAYMDRLESLILQPEVVRSQNLRIVFTPIHGTGGTITAPMLRRMGFQFVTVPEQDVMDGRFPTVKSPNPENAEALAMGIALAKKEKADLVIATDPDADRMGVAVRNAADELELLTGNQIGSLMAWYRAKTYFDLGILTPQNAGRGVIIKTFVTTDLQKAIAEHFGLRCVETLTGFKYIGEKLGKYEAGVPSEFLGRYRKLPETETRKLRLEHSTFYVFGGEESYGYSGADFVRDKDANGAVVMFAETAAYAKSLNLTLPELLDQIYSTLGFYLEKNASLTFEGAEGAAKIRKLVASYAAKSPKVVDGCDVTGTRDFEAQTFFDVEGDAIPKEKMLIVDLADGRRFAVRASGTEPKIKYYMYGVRKPGALGGFDAATLKEAKAEVSAGLDSLWKSLQADVEERLAE